MAPAIRFAHAAILLLFSAATLADSQTTASGISEVTVYPDRASVTRVHRVAVLPGAGTVRIHPLPPGLNSDSLRVRAGSLDGLTLRHAETRVVHGREFAHPQEQHWTERLLFAQDERRRVGDARQAQALQLGFIQRLSENAGAVEPGLPPEHWPQAWALIGDGASDTLKRMAALDAELRDIDNEINRIQNELNALRTNRRDTLEVTIHYQTTNAGEAEITLEYEVPGASWAPLYEARLDTVAGRMRWVQRAEVRQNTGESWEDVVLHLSTARPALGGRLPQLQPWFLDIAPPARAAVTRREMAASSAMDMMVAPAPMAEASILETTGFTSYYRVPNRVSLPSDNREQRFLLTSRDWPAELSARAVPALSPHAYLFAQTVFEEDTPLLPGPVNLFQDGQLVGQTRVGTVAPGAPLRLAFGVDDRIEISRVLDRDSLGREGLLRRQHRLERSYRVTVDNRHDRPLLVTVLERMPVARDERIRVDLAPAATVPSERDVDGRLGVLAWNMETDPGTQATLRFGYTVSWPEDIDHIQGLDPAWQ